MKTHDGKKQIARLKYNKIRNQAWSEYEKACALGLDEYAKTCSSIDSEGKAA